MIILVYLRYLFIGSRLLKMNEYQMENFVSKMVAAMFNTVAGKRIALFGAAFKANTSDTRELLHYLYVGHYWMNVLKSSLLIRMHWITLESI